MRRSAILLATISVVAGCKSNRPVIVAGTIQSIELAAGKPPVVVLRTETGLSISCRFPATRAPEISKLVVNQELRLRGETSNGTVVENCAIEWAGRKPGQREEDDDDD